MLTTCFLHLPGIGPVFEEKLKNAGIFTWGDALAMPLPCSPAKGDIIRAGAEESLKRLEAGDARWFGDALPPSEQWRLFPHFSHSAAYVDIETTGLSQDEDGITTIALYDGTAVYTYVQGRNLEDFADDILRYTLLVTWNGRCFDAPILRRQLRIPLDKGPAGHMAHLDLRPVFRGLGLRGGLKKVEKFLGLDRDELDGVDGWTAVLLWREYERTGNPRALETLLAYNVADVLSLEVLAQYALTHHAPQTVQRERMVQGNEAARTAAQVARIGWTDAEDATPVKTYLNPFKADVPLLRKLLSHSRPW